MCYIYLVYILKSLIIKIERFDILQQEETKQNTSWWVLIAIGLGVFMAMLDVLLMLLCQLFNVSLMQIMLIPSG